MPRDLLTVKEVARLLGVTPLTVRNWDAKGKLVARRHPLNNYRVYKVGDIEDIMKEMELSKNFARPAPAKKEPEKPQVKKLRIDVL